MELPKTIDLHMHSTVSDGSDYHGKNKLVSLGSTGMNEAIHAPDGLLRFLKEVRPCGI